MKTSLISLIALAAGLAACTERSLEGQGNLDVVAVTPAAETTAVASKDDAADDPAIWINTEDTAKSLIIGTDKKAGLYVYNLTGEIVDFAPIGKANNVDLRQGLSGQYDTLVTTSNRTTNTVDVLALEDGKLIPVATYPTSVEPYGLCMGHVPGKNGLSVAVTYKNGNVEVTDITFDAAGMKVEPLAPFTLPSKLEGCAFDDKNGELYIGEEASGVWKFPSADPKLATGKLLAKVGSETGMVADVEGIDVYHGKDGRRILVASSQGDFTYVAFEVKADSLVPLKKFRIGENAAKGIDRVQETDGLAVTSAALGDMYPEGILVVQDGYNAPEPQNFKIVDWREVKALFK